MLPGSFYHIYNRAVSNNTLFVSEDNYRYFLKKYAFYIHPVARTFSYCLMPNHFHFLIKIRTTKEINLLNGINDFKNNQSFVSKQFSNLFSSYTQAFNRRQDRKGNLFSKNFKRKLIDNDSYYTRLICYIHNNPVHHNIATDINDWKFSSYSAILENKTSKIEIKQVLKWFGSTENYFEYHKQINNDDLFSEIEYL